jgi:hypothetical protein
MPPRCFRRVLSLAFLAPRIVEAIAAGNHRIRKRDLVAERVGFELTGDFVAEQQAI